MAMYLKITNGSTTFDLLGNDAANGFNLEADSWAPNVAQRDPNGRISDVVERIPLYASSTTSAATILANVDALNRVIDESDRLARGESEISPWIVRYSPNSNSDYVEAMILGPGKRGQAGIVLPSSFSDNLYQSMIDGVTLEFKRRGEWLDAEESNQSSSVNNGEIMSISLTATTNPSPTVLRLGVFNYSTGPNQTLGGFLLLAEDTDNIEIINPETNMASASRYSTVNESANHARNTNVMRYTPIATYTENGSAFSATLSGFNSSARLLGVFANFRNNSSTANFIVRPGLQRTLVGSENWDQRTVIPAGATTPKWYFLGIHAIASDVQVLRLLMQVDDLTGSPTLDCDTVVLVNMEKIHTVFLHNLTMANWVVSNTDLYVDHCLLTRPAPAVYMYTGSGTQAGISFEGHGVIRTESASLEALYLSTGGDSSAHWRRTNDTPAVMSLYSYGVRRPAYLVAK